MCGSHNGQTQSRERCNLFTRVFAAARVTFRENYKGKTKQRRGHHTTFNVTLQGSTRQKWDENPSKSNQLSHVQSKVSLLPSVLALVIGSNWIERTSQNGGNYQYRKAFRILNISRALYYMYKLKCVKVDS